MVVACGVRLHVMSDCGYVSLTVERMNEYDVQP